MFFGIQECAKHGHRRFQKMCREQRGIQKKVRGKWNGVLSYYYCYYDCFQFHDDAFYYYYFDTVVDVDDENFFVVRDDDDDDDDDDVVVVVAKLALLVFVVGVAVD